MYILINLPNFAWFNPSRSLEFMTILGYTLALVVAIAILGAIFSRDIDVPDFQNIQPLDFTPSQANEPLLSLACIDDGIVLLSHEPLPMGPQDTAHLVVTKTKHNVLIREKRGDTHPGDKTAMKGTSLITCLPAQTFQVRFESEVTGQWATCTLTCTQGTRVTPTLHY